MNLKSLILKVIPSVIIAMGIYTFEASAQPGPPQEQQDGIVPYFSAHLWVGEDYRTAYDTSPTTSNDRHKDFLIDPSPSGNTEFGIKGKMGNFFVQGAMAAIFNPADYSVSADVGNSFIKYDIILNDFWIKLGKFATPWAGVNIFDTAHDDGMINEAASGESPRYQLQASYKGFYIDILQVQSDVTTNIDLRLGAVPPPAPILPKFIGDISRDDYNASYPKIGIGYATPGFQPIMGKATFVYQEVTIDDGSAVQDKKVVSWSGNATIDAMLGGFILHLHGFYSQNQGDMGFSSWCYSRSVVDGDKIENTKGYGGNAGIAYKLGSTVFAVGAGYEVYDNDLFAKKDDELVYFASINYTVSPNLIISPVFKCFDYRKSTGKSVNGVTVVEPFDEGKEYKFGILCIAMM